MCQFTFWPSFCHLCLRLIRNPCLLHVWQSCPCRLSCCLLDDSYKEATVSPLGKSWQARIGGVIQTMAQRAVHSRIAPEECSAPSELLANRQSLVIQTRLYKLHPILAFCPFGIIRSSSGRMSPSDNPSELTTFSKRIVVIRWLCPHLLRGRDKSEASLCRVQPGLLFWPDNPNEEDPLV